MATPSNTATPHHGRRLVLLVFCKCRKSNIPPVVGTGTLVPGTHILSSYYIPVDHRLLQ